MPSVGHIQPDHSKDITISFKTTKPQSLKGLKIAGKVSRISYTKAASKDIDWDDRMKSVQWVTMVQQQHPTVPLDDAVSVPPPPRFPPKKKIIETESEPPHSVLDDHHRDLELSITAIADYSKYECPIKEIKFKDTLMYQTRVYSFNLKNISKVDMTYQWSILNKDGSPISVSLSSLCLNDNGSMMSEGGEIIPFSISPLTGVIPLEKDALITIRFSPLDVMIGYNILHCQ